MWYYFQERKLLQHNKIKIGIGYSGHGDGKDKHEYEAVRNVGPIPTGRYTIGIAYTHARKGPLVMKLTPNGHNARGRTGFLIHGDSRTHPGEASEGCIVLGIDFRRRIAESHDYDLEVLR